MGAEPLTVGIILLPAHFGALLRSPGVPELRHGSPPPQVMYAFRSTYWLTVRSEQMTIPRPQVGALYSLQQADACLILMYIVQILRCCLR
jgi:hypothetical protein